MPKVRPIIALVTDFGLADPYVGAMKGAILTVCPEATLVDVTHEIEAHDVAAGALALDAAYRHFPPGTVFAAVVDPGVGSDRLPLAVAAGEWLFVGPDNGLFTFVLERHPQARVHRLTNPALRREPVSAVFHGRDVFGPAAGRLALGLRVEESGPPVADPVRLALPPKRRRDGGFQGIVLHVDRFGSLVTNLVEADLAALSGPPLEVVVGGRALPLVRTYSDVRTGEPCALMGSSGRLEIAVNRGRADSLLGVTVLAEVLVRARS
jgi:S-adenosylmethionine hydrolase